MFFAKKVLQISYNTKYSNAIENTHNFRGRNKRERVIIFGVTSFLDVFGHRTKSHRGNWWFRFPHVLSVFGALYISFSNPAKCINNEESLSSMSKIGIAESPETNRHNKRNSNGRFSKLRKGGHKEKSSVEKRFSCKKKPGF